jgi:hypothetical protein
MAAFLSSDTTIKYESASTSGGALERRGGQGGTCGGVLSPRTGRRIKGKKIENKTRRGLRWLPTSKKYATTNQKHAGAMGEG